MTKHDETSVELLIETGVVSAREYQERVKQVEERTG